jgi:hypothetical protein
MGKQTGTFMQWNTALAVKVKEMWMYATKWIGLKYIVVGEKNLDSKSYTLY